MPGERVHDSTPSSTQGSSDDDISLREHVQRQLDLQGKHFERVIDDLKEKLDERQSAQVIAIGKLESATERRFEGVNEFRDQLRDQAATFISKSEANVRMDSLAEKIEGNASRIGKVENAISASAGKSSGLDKAWGYIIGAVGLAAAVIGIIISTR